MGADEMDTGIRAKKKPSKKSPGSTTTSGRKKAGTVARARKKPPGKPTGARTQPTLGWREWVGLPDHGVEWLKAKVDTGARTSSLHAAGLHTFQVENREWVRFHVYPWQRSTADAVQVDRAARTLQDICSDDATDLARLSVGLRVVRGLLATG